jgi:UDP-glucose 4-epimerase
LKTAKVVLTGSRGYVGTATKELLQDSGYEVIEVDKKIGRNTFYIFRYVVGKKPTCIIHLSAKKSIPDSIKNPWSYYFNNVLSTLATGIVSRVFSIPVVFASSAAVYRPNNPYAKSKIVEEKILKFACKKLVILRYFNIVGKTKNIHDKQSGNIFSVINKNPSIKVNSLKSKRDYVHILDVAKANVLAVSYVQKNDFIITDIFTGIEKTMIDVINEYFVNGVKIEYAVVDLPDVTVLPKVDNRKILGWTPKYTFSDGVRSEVLFKDK